MPPETKDKLKKLEDLFKMVNEGLTREEFTTSFKSVVDLVLKVEKQLIGKVTKAITTLESRIDTRLEQVRGADGKDGKNGSDGKDGINGKDGVGEKGEQGLVGVGKAGRNGKDGTDGSPDMAEDIRNKLELLDGEDRLGIKAIDGLEDKLEELEKRPIGRGGGTSAMGVAQAFKYIAHTEEPVGLINGSNKVYTVSVDIWWIAGFTLNGENIAELPNYTYSARTITFSTALPAAYSGKDFEIKYIG